MAVSAAKLEANRRNAQKSTGPRTEAGKECSKLNAVTHGLRAETLVLRTKIRRRSRIGERPGVPAFCPVTMSSSVSSMTPSFTPGSKTGPGEPRPPGQCQSSSMTASREASTEEEVDGPGPATLQGSLGPLVVLSDRLRLRRDDFRRDEHLIRRWMTRTGRATWSCACNRRSSAASGCSREWARLKAILDQGQAWLSSDKLKAVRLLGKQPFDAIDDRDVAMVFLASFVLKPDGRASGTGKSRWS